MNALEAANGPRSFCGVTRDVTLTQTGTDVRTSIQLYSDCCVPVTPDQTECEICGRPFGYEGHPADESTTVMRLSPTHGPVKVYSNNSAYLLFAWRCGECGSISFGEKEKPYGAFCAWCGRRYTKETACEEGDESWRL